MGIKKPSGYSATPLYRKLGIKNGFLIRIVHPPSRYEDFFRDFPDNVHFAKEEDVDIDFIHLFVLDSERLVTELPDLREQLKQNGMIWISWPKKASKVETDLDGNAVRNIGLKHGLVDIKVCSVNEVWSGLKFVIPLKDRK
ncbi:DUF3052 family protein [Muriicola soli]|uniref:DUF3052 family protein n=1 Tax=Muriicola soli TaxID=2507538 RepID=A0A411E796_9FLAO|nr:DUF3052 family protein [Muriicola soli]QBA63394.1 DUF3052 family protein [Muriicola soli]